MRRRDLAVLGLSWAAAAAPLHAQDAAQWGFYSADRHATRYSPLAQIDESNVGRLRVVWRHAQADPAILAANPDFSLTNRYMVTPIYVDGRLYVPNGFGLAEAIDPKTGRTLWTQKPLIDGPEGLPSLMISKGVAYSGRGDDARILTVRQQHLFALSPKSGEPIASFGDGGKVDLSTAEFRYKWNGVPVVAGDVVILGSSMLEQDSAVYKDGPPGYVRAFDVRTGALRWTFHTIPHEGEPGYETWETGTAVSGAANVWSTITADRARGWLFLPVSTPTPDFYGGDRPGANLFSDSLVALEAATGKRIWHFQTVHHDLWDYDVATAPKLLTVSHEGRRVDIVAQPTKHGFLYVFERDSGRPLWPIEERPVPQSDVPGEQTWPTQPIPTLRYGHQGIEKDDLIDFTPALRAEAERIVAEHRIGPIYTPAVPFNPNGPISTLMVMGGSNWPGGSFDPETNLIYVTASVGVNSMTICRYPEGSVMPHGVCTGRDAGAFGGLRNVSVQGLPLLKPPYGTIAAIDLTRGAVAWEIPNGETPENVKNHPTLAGVALGRTGRAGQPPGALATKTLLIVAEPGYGPTPDGKRGSMLRAYDKRTGRELAALQLPAPQSGSPMTYMVNDRQYLVIAVSANDYPGELLAYALPRERPAQRPAGE